MYRCILILSLNLKNIIKKNIEIFETSVELHINKLIICVLTHKL